MCDTCACVSVVCFLPFPTHMYVFSKCSPFLCQIIKESSEGPSVVTVKPSEVKSASFDKKLFSVLDRHSNTLTVNDNVRVLDGPLKVYQQF